MVIKSYHNILAVKILGWFLLKWAGFGELLGWKSSTRSGNTVQMTDSFRNDASLYKWTVESLNDSLNQFIQMTDSFRNDASLYKWTVKIIEGFTQPVHPDD